jgi:hypothetical protein
MYVRVYIYILSQEILRMGIFEVRFEFINFFYCLYRFEAKLKLFANFYCRSQISVSIKVCSSVSKLDVQTGEQTDTSFTVHTTCILRRNFVSSSQNGENHKYDTCCLIYFYQWKCPLKFVNKTTQFGSLRCWYY